MERVFIDLKKIFYFIQSNFTSTSFPCFSRVFIIFYLSSGEFLYQSYSNNLWNEFCRSFILFRITYGKNFHREVGDLYFISNNLWNFYREVGDLYFISSNLWNEFSSILKRYYILYRIILRVLVFLDQVSHVFSSFFIFYLVNFCMNYSMNSQGRVFFDQTSYVFSSFFIFHLVNFCTKTIRRTYGIYGILLHLEKLEIFILFRTIYDTNFHRKVGK